MASPYTGVVTDSTLTGAGTANSPLHVVPTSATIAPVTIMDSTGAIVGRFMFPNLVFVTVNNVLFASPLGPRDNTFESGMDFSQLPIYYANADCSGTPYISPQAFGVRTAVVAKVGGIGGQVLAYVSTGAVWQAVSLTWQSSANWNGSSYACSNGTGTIGALTAATIDVTGMFHEPFVMQ